jgi:hypothetical protein
VNLRETSVSARNIAFEFGFSASVGGVFVCCTLATLVTETATTTYNLRINGVSFYQKENVFTIRLACAFLSLCVQSSYEVTTVQ